jgi:hypothetical protein
VGTAANEYAYILADEPAQIKKAHREIDIKENAYDGIIDDKEREAFEAKERERRPVNVVLDFKAPSPLGTWRNTGYKIEGASPKMQSLWRSMPAGQKNQLRRILPDSDRDGVPDKYDCQPFNARKQDDEDLPIEIPKRPEWRSYAQRVADREEISLDDVFQEAVNNRLYLKTLDKEPDIPTPMPEEVREYNSRRYALTPEQEERVRLDTREPPDLSKREAEKKAKELETKYEQAGAFGDFEEKEREAEEETNDNKIGREQPAQEQTERILDNRQGNPGYDQQGNPGYWKNHDFGFPTFEKIKKKSWWELI